MNWFSVQKPFKTINCYKAKSCQTPSKSLLWNHNHLCISMYHQRKSKNLTSEYTESCRRRSVNQGMRSRRCDPAEMCEMRRLWWVGLAQNAIFFHSFVASESQLQKTGIAEDRLPKMSPKFQPRCGARAVRKSKSLKTERFGRLFEVEDRKICITLCGLRIKIVKHVKKWHKLATSGRFLKLKAARFAPRCGTRAIGKSKSLKHQGLGPLFDFKVGKISTTL